ncbi:PREDICTED: fas apoptotic inhibitory molecule 3-like [Galeopterus variegatus]|uniref:Fas apoptotic inhibitory molecule 3-like n=1 Tax=Galeopterus variegatus TaxID=482537 RepID=A0ABM0SAX4_GALVR|nr:PREDICTED: fas apoptotic inhibitory molecule 3-like [Galeopterus variegatus]
MDLLLWSLYFLPVSGGLRSLPEVKLEGELGGSVLIKCPLPVMNVRIYLCREMAKSGVCATVVSNNNFVKEEYRSRVSLELCQDKSLFLVEATKLSKSDSGVYACGVGVNKDWAKTLQVTLSVHNEYEPFWEEEPTPEPPKLFQKFLRLRMPFWQMSARASSEFISKVTTPARRTEAPPANHTSPTTPIRHYPRVSRASSVPAANPSTLLPSTTASKTPTREGLLRPQPASHNHHTRLHRQRVSEGPWLPAPSLKTGYEYVGFYHQPAATMEDNDSDDYINIPSLTHLPRCPLGPDLGANESCLSVDF